jgi:hypothetical protein
MRLRVAVTLARFRQRRCFIQRRFSSRDTVTPPALTRVDCYSACNFWKPIDTTPICCEDSPRERRPRWDRQPHSVAPKGNCALAIQGRGLRMPAINQQFVSQAVGASSAADDLEHMPVAQVLAHFAVKPDRGLSSTEASSIRPQRPGRKGTEPRGQTPRPSHGADRLHDRSSCDRLGGDWPLGRLCHHSGPSVQGRPCKRRRSCGHRRKVRS